MNIENKNLPIETRKAYQKTRDEIGILIIKQTGFDNFCNSFTQIIHSSLSFYSVNLYLVEKGKNYIVLKAGTGTLSQSAIQKGHKFEIAPNSFIGAVAFNRKANFVTKNQMDSPVWHSSADLPSIRSEIGISLISRKRNFLIGVLDIHSDQYDAFTSEDCNTFEEIVREAEIFLEEIAFE